ncbi:MAG: hypothetical protein K2N94_11120, partial [Lachnospiraceae bacterium]|nr:hypothetical protein [Lachnospiraceae bacterium]
MTYNSLPFVLFFACFAAVYLVMPRVWLRQAVILLGSLAFYIFAGGPHALAVVVATSVIVYAASRAIDRVYAGYETEKNGLTPKEAAALFAGYKKRGRKILVPALVLIVGILIYVKSAKLLGFTQVSTIR